MMSTRLIGFACLLLGTAFGHAARNAGDWKTWVITSGKDHGVPPPPRTHETRQELEQLRDLLQDSNPAVKDQIRFWDSGPPSFRWMELVAKRQSAGQPVGAFPRAYAYVSMAIYDATIAVENAKQTYRRPRPSAIDRRLRERIPAPESSSYPSDYAATAWAAASVLAYLVPAEAGHFEELAEQAGKSRLYAGVEYPSDYEAGMALGRRVAEQVIAKARADGSDATWQGTVPQGTCMWTGTNPANVTASQWRPLLLTTPSEFRPAAPPPCGSAEAQAQLEEVRNFPRALTTANLNTNSRALYWQTAEGIFPWAVLQLNQWVLEDKLERDPAAAARAYALLGTVGYDAFIASQDAKFTYWYLRPAQLDPSLATLFPAPNFPSYPSNHSVLSTARAEVLAYLFPDRAAHIRAIGKEAGDSRIWAGIHYPMDNETGAQLGRRVAQRFLEWAQNDGSHR